MSFWKKIFGRKKQKTSSEIDEEDFYDAKMEGLEQVLGKSHNMVGHAIIPFALGGTVDMYYFPNGIKGTGIATMELISEDLSGPIPNKHGVFELVAFTQEGYTDWKDQANPFADFNNRFNSILTRIGDYAFSAKLAPYQTCELPIDDDKKLFFIFDKYAPNKQEFKIYNKTYCLLLIIEIHEDESLFARKNGGKALIEKLKSEKIYPYSDMNRNSVLVLH